MPHRSASELTQADFQRHAVWRFHADDEVEGADESQVSPADDAPRRGGFGSFLVSASYQLRNGQSLPGVVQVDLLGSRLFFTPVVVHAGGKQVDPLAHDAAIRLTRITGTARSEPVRWQLAVALSGEAGPRSGRIARSVFMRVFGLLLRLVVLRFSR